MALVVAFYNSRLEPWPVFKEKLEVDEFSSMYILSQFVFLHDIKIKVRLRSV